MGTWLSDGADQVWEPGSLVVSTRLESGKSLSVELESFSRRESDLSVTLFCFVLPCLMRHSQGCLHLSISSLDQDSGPWVVSKKSVILALLRGVHGVVTSSCVHLHCWAELNLNFAGDIKIYIYIYEQGVSSKRRSMFNKKCL